MSEKEDKVLEGYWWEGPNGDVRLKKKRDGSYVLEQAIEVIRGHEYDIIWKEMPTRTESESDDS